MTSLHPCKMSIFVLISEIVSLWCNLQHNLCLFSVCGGGRLSFSGGTTALFCILPLHVCVLERSKFGAGRTQLSSIIPYTSSTVHLLLHNNKFKKNTSNVQISCWRSREQNIFCSCWWILLHWAGYTLGQLMNVVALSKVSSQLLDKGVRGLIKPCML